MPYTFRFKYSRLIFSLGDEDYKWLVPITICTSENPSEPAMKTLLTDKEMVIFVKDVTESQWLKASMDNIIGIDSMIFHKITCKLSCFVFIIDLYKNLYYYYYLYMEALTIGTLRHFILKFA